MTVGAPPGIAFLADAEGVVRSILRDGLGLGARLAPGTQFGTILEPASQIKWSHFLESTAREKATFNWQMDVVDEGSVMSLDFAAAESEGGLVVVATPASEEDSHRLYEQLLAISNEQSTTLREALKRLSMMRRSAPPPTAELWAEQTRINNELVNLQRKLAQRNAELKRSNEQKNELLGIAAHDLRNPISSVRLYCDVLLAAPLEERPRRSITRIRAICDFMVHIVDDLLDLSSLEAGRLVLDLKAVDFAELVASNVALNRDLASVKRISIELVPSPEPLPPITVDAYRFEQVLNNLLSNAVKYSHPDSGVLVTVRRDEKVVVVTVRDQGQGIEPSELGRLFKPFERTSTRATAGEKSTGLGLAIVERVVRAHGGTISVESVVRQGTSFEVRLPIHRP